MVQDKCTKHFSGSHLVMFCRACKVGVGKGGQGWGCQVEGSELPMGGVGNSGRNPTLGEEIPKGKGVESGHLLSPSLLGAFNGA